MKPSETHSALKFYSLAIVANNKALSSKIIQATPIEELTMLDGEIASIPIDHETEGLDAQGNTYSTKVKTDIAVEAEWLPMRGSNRRTPPDVRRGERVILWKYADVETLYWTSLGLDDHLRKLETAIYTFSGTADEDVDSLAPENCYSVEISTHTGQITLRTSKANDEFCVYALQINTKSGRVLLIDDIGNEFEFDSKNTLISFTNADKTTWQLDKQKIYGYAPDSITLKADQSILMQTQDYKIETQTYTLQSDTNEIKSSSTSVEGTVDFKGKVTFQQETEFKAKITAAGMVSSAPIQGPSDTI